MLLSSNSDLNKITWSYINYKIILLLISKSSAISVKSRQFIEIDDIAGILGALTLGVKIWTNRIADWHRILPLTSWEIKPAQKLFICLIALLIVTENLSIISIWVLTENPVLNIVDKNVIDDLVSVFNWWIWPNNLESRGIYAIFGEADFLWYVMPTKELIRNLWLGYTLANILASYLTGIS